MLSEAAEKLGAVYIEIYSKIAPWISPMYRVAYSIDTAIVAYIGTHLETAKITTIEHEGI